MTYATKRRPAMWVIIVLLVVRSVPAAAPSTQKGVTSLDVCAEQNRIHLLIANRIGDGPTQLEYLRSDDRGVTWSKPERVGEGQPPPDIAHRGMDAQIAAAGDRLVAAWTVRGEENRFGRGPIATALSNDGGKTWRAGPNPADDGTAGDHAFIDIAADEQGTFHLTWLDARAGSKGLLYTRSTDGGATWSPNAILKRDTCECCWNTITTAPGGEIYILFRDKNPRDMAIIGSRDGGKSWQKPVRVGAFDWDFTGCPHVGGGLAAKADAKGRTCLCATVWTAKAGSAGAYALASTDNGATWSEPVRLGDNEASHPDIACAGAKIVAAWDAFTDGGTAIFASASSGAAWSGPKRLSEIGAVATHPRIVRTDKAFVVFWTEQRTGEPSRWVARQWNGEIEEPAPRAASR